jgi:acetyl-CoA C-acetyltransferase
MKEAGMRRVAVLGGMRIPFCRSHTAYAELSNLDMLTAALAGLADKFTLHGAHIDEVVGGAVVTHAKDWNLAREAVIGSPLAPITVEAVATADESVVFSLPRALRIAAE